MSAQERAGTRHPLGQVGQGAGVPVVAAVDDQHPLAVGGRGERDNGAGRHVEPAPHLAGGRVPHVAPLEGRRRAGACRRAGTAARRSGSPSRSRGWRPVCVPGRRCGRCRPSGRRRTGRRRRRRPSRRGSGGGGSSRPVGRPPPAGGRSRCGRTPGRAGRAVRRPARRRRAGAARQRSGTCGKPSVRAARRVEGGWRRAKGRRTNCNRINCPDDRRSVGTGCDCQGGGWVYRPPAVAAGAGANHPSPLVNVRPPRHNHTFRIPRPRRGYAASARESSPGPRSTMSEIVTLTPAPHRHRLPRRQAPQAGARPRHRLRAQGGQRRRRRLGRGTRPRHPRAARPHVRARPERQDGDGPHPRGAVGPLRQADDARRLRAEVGRPRR